MKQYDNKLKKWVSQEQYDKSHPKRSANICRGGKPHDFVLVLPYGVTYNEKYAFNPEAYYKVQREVEEFHAKKYEQLLAIGIVASGMKPWKYWNKELHVCSVCKKQKYLDL